MNKKKKMFCVGRHLGDVTGDPDQLVTLLVNEELALGALEALASQPPDSIVAVSAECSLKKMENST